VGRFLFLALFIGLLPGLLVGDTPFTPLAPSESSICFAFCLSRALSVGLSYVKPGAGLVVRLLRPGVELAD